MPDTPPATADSERYYARLPQSRITSRRLVSSVSLPEGLDGGSRDSSYQYDGSRDDHGENKCKVEDAAAEMQMQMQRLALHPLRTRLPCENLVRPSVSMGLGLQ